MDTQVLVRFHHLNVHSLDVHWYRKRVFAPSEVHHQLLGFPCIELEAFQLAPIHKALGQISLLPVVICDEVDDCGVIRELFSRWQLAELRVKSAV